MSFEETVHDYVRKYISQDSSMPYYAQFRDMLKAMIERGDLRANDTIPGEMDLCNLLGVSRTVIRQAMSELVNDGLVVRKQGKGTFVSGPRIERQSDRVAGLSEELTRQGSILISTVLRKEIVKDHKYAHLLGLSAEDSVVELERLRFTNGEPLALVTSYISYTLFAPIFEEDFTSQSLYQQLETKCGVKIVSCRRTMEAILAGVRESELLKIDVGSAVAKVDGIGYAADRAVVEYHHTFYRGDRIRFVVESGSGSKFGNQKSAREDSFNFVTTQADHF